MRLKKQFRISPLTRSVRDKAKVVEVNSFLSLVTHLCNL